MIANITKNTEYPVISLSHLLLFCAYVVIWYLQVGIRIPALGAIRIEMLWAIMLILIAICYRLYVGVHNPLTPYLYMFFFVILIQVPLSCDIDYSWNIFIDRVFKFSCLSFFIVCFVKSPRDLIFFLGAFLLSCAKMGQEGLTGQITGSLVWQNQGIMRLHGTTPLYIHPNSFSGMALGTLPFILYLWEISNKKIRILLVFLLIFSMNIIIHTGSRTGYVGFLLMCLFYFYQSKHKFKLFALSIVLLIAAMVYLPNQYQARFMSTFSEYENEDTSSGKRVEILKDAWHIFLKHPIGVGVGAFPIMRHKTFNRDQDTHNLYLEILTNIGIQGLIIFFALIYKMLKTLKIIEADIEAQQKKISMLEHTDSLENLSSHLRDLSLLKAVSRSIYLFVILRLALGLFGMDLYEIYWWFALGATISILNISAVAKIKTEQILQ